MARETKAQREERMAVERANDEARLANAYPARLLAALERASNLNYELTVSNSRFNLVDRDADYSWREQTRLTLTWDRVSERDLTNLEDDLTSKEEAQAEAERRYKVKEEARRKVNEMLNDEERELLGL